MEKKVLLFSIGLVIGFLFLISLSNLNLAQAAICSDRGEFCGFNRLIQEMFDCCLGECTDGSCQCLRSVCCELSIGGNRGVACYCEEECRSALTCTGGTCCDDRAAYKRDAGVACYCDVECKSGQCIGGVCAGADTCTPAGCSCIDTTRNCERLIDGVPTSGLNCPDPSFDVCCCPETLPPVPPPPPNGNGFCDSPCNPPCTCNRGPLCPGIPIDCCNGSMEYMCCCPIPSPPPPPPPGPSCGNGVIDAGEQCEIDSDCSSGMTCVSCSCVEESFVIGGNGGIIDLRSPLGCTTIEECISRMINFLFSLAVILAPLMIILAGFLYITAAGRPEKIVQAQKLITWTLVGFLIVSLARAIVYVITSVIGG